MSASWGNATPNACALRTPIASGSGSSTRCFQAGMGWVARAELAAAVSEAGGLGVIGAGRIWWRMSCGARSRQPGA